MTQCENVHIMLFNYHTSLDCKKNPIINIYLNELGWMDTQESIVKCRIFDSFPNNILMCYT